MRPAVAGDVESIVRLLDQAFAPSRFESSRRFVAVRCLWWVIRGYYSRFGFCRLQEPGCPFDPGNAQFMALRYLGPDSFMIGYEKEFSGGEPVA